MAERHGTNSKHPRRRLAARRPVAAYGRTVQRCLLLILIASAPFLIGERPQSWDVLAGAGALAHFAAFLKFDARSIFAIIGITSPWILPMVGRSARVRGAFLLGSVAVHALLCQLFYGATRCQPLFFWGFAVSAFVFGFRSLSCIPYGSEVWIRVGLQDQRATEARSKFFGP